MPTLVQFDGGQSLTVAEDFDVVNQQLNLNDAGLFKQLVGDEPGPRVTVYRSSVAYIQEPSEGKGSVGFVA
jgi:hypothetical protein